MKFNKKILATIAVALMLTIAGCGEMQDNTGKANSQDLDKSTGENVSDVPLGGSANWEAKYTEKGHIELVKHQPPPDFDRSLERQNLIRRNKLLNDQNEMFYVYLLSHGKVVAKFTAKGKVSSVNSRLTNGEQIVATEQCINQAYREDEASCYQAIESPQIDGSYGTNGNGIFFFTTDGKYVEWNGQYVTSNQPLNIHTPLVLTDDIDDNGGDGHDHSENETAT